MSARDDRYDNEHGVVLMNGGVMIAKPPKDMGRISALVHAAWIVRLIDPTGDAFAEVLRQVRGRSSKG